MGNYITAIWGWDDQVQRRFHTRAFNPGRWQIITAGGTDLGMLDVEYRPSEIYSVVRVRPQRPGLPVRAVPLAAVIPSRGPGRAGGHGAGPLDGLDQRPAQQELSCGIPGAA
jgi:hypothetical protein